MPLYNFRARANGGAEKGAEGTQDVESDDESQEHYLGKRKRYRISRSEDAKEPQGDAAESIVINYDVDPYDYDDERLFELVMDIWKHFDLLRDFDIQETSLLTFLREIRDLYHRENSFHNFRHVWSVMHICFQIFLHGGSDLLERIDILASFIAALCHDVDHPGNNNAFEVATKSKLAERYCSESVCCVLEQHHACITAELLHKHRTTVFHGLSQGQFEQLLHQVREIILGTDMSRHHNLVEETVQYTNFRVQRAIQRNTGEIVSMPTKCPIDNKSQEFRLSFTRIAVHSADIGGQTQSTTVALKWFDRCYSEFMSQATKEQQLGIKTSNFIHGLERNKKKYATQYDFINDIIEPLWKALTDMLPDLRFAHDQLRENKESYSDKLLK